MTATRTANRRIGPKMLQAAAYVYTHPGCTNQEVAIAIGPNGSHAFGDRAVKRAAAAGLLENRPQSAWTYRWHVTAAGEALVSEKG